MSKKRPNRGSADRQEGQFHKIFNAATDGLIVIDASSRIVLEANPAACAMHGTPREDFIGSTPGAFLHPESKPRFQIYLRAVRSSGASDAQMLHRRQDGSTFRAEWRGAAITYRGRPCLLGVVRDVSRRVQTDRRLQQRAAAYTGELGALLEISHTLASTMELHPGVILRQLQGIIEYSHAGLFGLTDSTLTSLAVRGGPELEAAAPFQVQLDGPEIQAALYNGHTPVRIADLQTPGRESGVFRSVLVGDAGRFLQGVRSWMWVPLAVKGRMIGGLGLAQTRRGYFTAHHADLALSMADQVALTIVSAELYEHAQGLAALQERQRLAQNLHDAVNQSLFSAGLIAEVLPRLWEREPEEARRSLEDLRRLTRGALAEMRALLAELRPSTLTDAELGDLLRLLGNAFTGRTNIPVAVTVHGAGSLPAETQVAVYRICQEAMSNIAKHAGASQVEIDVRHAPDRLELRLRDNGAGFAASEVAPSGHYGLGMMRERAEAVGADLTVSSQPGEGTELTIRWGAPVG